MDLNARMNDIFHGEISTFSVRLEVVDFRRVGVFGSVKVVFLSSEEIMLSGKYSEVAIFGRNLKISRSETEETYITGEIERVENKKFKSGERFGKSSDKKSKNSGKKRK